MMCNLLSFFQEGHNPRLQMLPYNYYFLSVCACVIVRVCVFRLICLASAQPSLHCRLSAIFHSGFNDL